MVRNILWLFIFPALLSGQHGTFQECWSHVQRAFTAGAASEAHAMLQYMEDEFVSEELFTERAFQRRFLPARALLQIEFGEFAEAAQNLQNFIATLNPPRRQRAWAEWTLARIAHQNGEQDIAEQRYRDFIADYNDLSEFWLAQWFLADLLEQQGHHQSSLELRRKIADDTQAPDHLRQQSALKAATLAIQQNDPDLALEILQTLAWQRAGFPETAMLANIAFRLQELLRSSGQYQKALTCAHWIEPKSLLLEKQKSYLQQIREQWQRASNGWAKHAPIWQNHLERRLRIAEVWMDAFADTPDYTGDWIIAKTGAFLAVERPWLAMGILDVLENIEDIDLETHREAHFLRIHALQDINHWTAADLCAEEYIEKWPNDQRIPDIVFAIAKGWHGRGEIVEALQRLQHLRQSYPEHPSAASWKFHHARWLGKNGQIDAAMKIFSSFHEAFSASPLLPVAMYLAAEYALLYQDEKYFQEFAEQLNKAIHPEHSLQPYRHWLILRHAHFQDQKPDFVRQLDYFNKQYPEHPLWADAWNLHGDYHYANGEWEQALNSWQKISFDHGQAWHHAIFQRIQLHYQREQWSTCVSLLQRYRERFSQPEYPPLQATAILHWLGRLIEEPAAVDPATTELKQFLHLWRNSPKIEDILPVLKKLQRAAAEHSSEFDWESWFNPQLENAFSTEQWTWWSRLILFQSTAKNLSENMREGYYLRIAGLVPKENLDARGLYHVGQVLIQSQFPDAEQYHQSLRNRFPHCPWIPDALFSLADWHHRDDPSAAFHLWNQLSTQFPGHPLAYKAQWQMADAEYRQGDLNSAKSRLETIISERQTAAVLKARSWQLLGKVAEKSDNPEEAIHCYHRVLTLFPGFAEITQSSFLNLLELYAQQNNYSAMEGLIDWLDSTNLNFASDWTKLIQQHLPVESPLTPSDQS